MLDKRVLQFLYDNLPKSFEKMEHKKLPEGYYSGYYYIASIYSMDCCILKETDGIKIVIVGLNSKLLNRIDVYVSETILRELKNYVKFMEL